MFQLPCFDNSCILDNIYLHSSKMQYLIHVIQGVAVSHIILLGFTLCISIISKQLSYLLYCYSVTFINNIVDFILPGCAKLASDVANSANGDVSNCSPLYRGCTCAPCFKLCTPTFKILPNTLLEQPVGFLVAISLQCFLTFWCSL